MQGLVGLGSLRCCGQLLLRSKHKLDGPHSILQTVKHTATALLALRRSLPPRAWHDSLRCRCQLLLRPKHKLDGTGGEPPGQLCVEAVQQLLCPWLTQQLLQPWPHLRGGRSQGLGKGKEGKGTGSETVKADVVSCVLRLLGSSCAPG